METKIKVVNLSSSKLKLVNGGEKEWVLLGCLVNPIVAIFAIGVYIGYNQEKKS